MTAKGKINASHVDAGHRIIVKATETGADFSRTKTGEGVQVARVLGKSSRPAQGYESRGKYIIHTTAGSFEAAPIQTMWLAPEDAAGIKRAHVEAMLEFSERQVDARETERARVQAEHEAAKTLDATSLLAQSPVEADHAEALEIDPNAAVDPEDNWGQDEECSRCGGPLASDGVCADDTCGADPDDLPDPDGSNVLPIPAGPWSETPTSPAPERHADELTLHSHAGKVDNMNNEAAAQTPAFRNDNRPPAPGEQVMTALPVNHTIINKAAILAKPIESLMDSGTKSHTGSTVVALLEKVWTRVREGHPELPEVVITTGSGEGVKWGHFRPESWKVRAEEGAAVSQAAPGRRHELFLSSEALAKGSTQVLQTMLHEAAHTLSRVREVSDTSRQGRWHNAQFRKAAEEMGLEHKGSKADKTHGFSFVTLTQATKDRYADLLGELEREIRLTGLLPSWLGGTGDEDERGGERMGKAPQGEDEGKPKTGNVKTTCTCVEPNIIRMSKKVLDMEVVRCDDCGDLFAERG